MSRQHCRVRLDAMNTNRSATPALAGRGTRGRDPNTGSVAIAPSVSNPTATAHPRCRPDFAVSAADVIKSPGFALEVEMQGKTTLLCAGAARSEEHTSELQSLA